jgi:hypothetical protein
MRGRDFSLFNSQIHSDRQEPHDHFVELYTDDEVLASNVGRYLSEGLRNGEPGIVVATPEHCAAFRRVVGETVGRVLFLDAEQTLSRFMVRGRPNWERFEKTITAAVTSVDRAPGQRIRAYGEMVGLLWTSGEYSAALELENFWNRILASLGALLYCAYPIDIFGPEFQASSIHGILCDHTHLLPAHGSEALERSLRTAMGDVLGMDAVEFNPPAAWGTVPSAERMILWLRETYPRLAPDILARAREDYRTRSNSVTA